MNQNLVGRWNMADSRLTGGRQSSLAISVFLTAPAWLRFMPLTRSVMYEDEAMAEPHPNVLNLTSEMMPVQVDSEERDEGRGTALAVSSQECEATHRHHQP